MQILSSCVVRIVSSGAMCSDYTVELPRTRRRHPNLRGATSIRTEESAVSVSSIYIET